MRKRLLSYCFRLSMSPEEHSEFWRKVQFTVDKDVVRTDRSNHFFRGENNPNVEIMRSDHFSLFSPSSFFPPTPYLCLFALTFPQPILIIANSQPNAQAYLLISYSEPWGSRK